MSEFPENAEPTISQKLAWSLPWLLRYPFWRTTELVRRLSNGIAEPPHLIFVVANHFEPAWSEQGEALPLEKQLRRVDDWVRMARTIGATVRDHDDTPFRHTNFYPAEQYHPPLLDKLAELQSEGLGETEIHLHHGVDKPDTAESLRSMLQTFRDVLSVEHKLLSRSRDDASPKYAFVHGNLALANSAGGRCCGVDSEMQVLADTGCYADFTLPAAPLQPQVPKINSIYECGGDFSQAVPHRTGRDLRVGVHPKLPVIFTGPLVFNWNRKVRGIPVPRVEDGVLAENYALNLDRLRRWATASIHVRGRREWVFVKLSCHGFFTRDQNQMIGESARAFWESVIEFSERTNSFKVHFASAREAFNMVMAAVDGQTGNPGSYRDYHLQTIMDFAPDVKSKRAIA